MNLLTYSSNLKDLISIFKYVLWLRFKIKYMRGIDFI